ncbi:TetR family transcriptional regulator [Acrocarpospora pleiomorpha]|uniref:TetR family transcriptional regulator n=1 Tax=Acrocarpospora pleiomorpha TaxID=90975 RepID=A0A5M3XM95_9ACTN|nr:TetR family transcriptional regulator [Acrocarpospora pleiomorpha]GES22497.1 TetR family transcriptional regulator [Acrocarpospora pleiomorpha]
MENETKSGRRPGNTQTREAILEAAMTSFIENGYGGTTIRGVARAAGVDPALVMHFFGNKDGLFGESIRNGGMPVQQLVESFDGDLETLGERLATRYFTLWEDPEIGPRIKAVVVSAATSPAAAGILKDFMVHELAGPLVKHLGPDRPQQRALLAASQLMGIVFARYVIQIEIITALTLEEIVACVAPSIQRFLTGDLPLR